MRIETRGICFSYSHVQVLKNVSFGASEGELIAILGPNGVGKTTFFRCLLGFLKPISGEVLVNDKPVGSFRRKELAHELAYIPQSYRPAFNLTVLDSVLMGLASQLGTFANPTEADNLKAMKILEALGIGKLAQRGSMKISGGERQLMLLGRALIQDAHVLILDEPTANLDYGNSFRVMQRLVALKEQGYTIIFSTHDPDQALRYASRVIAMTEGTILADGTPSDVLTPEVLKGLYNINVAVNTVEAGKGQYKVCTPFEL